MGYQVSFYLTHAEGLPGVVTPGLVAAVADWHVRHAFDDARTDDDGELALLLRASDEGAAATLDEGERVALRRLVTREFGLDEGLLALADRVGRAEASALRASSADEAFLLDRLVDLVLSPWGACAKDAPFVPTMAADGWASLRSANAAADFLTKECGPLAFRLWRYLLEGRGIGRDNERFPYTAREFGAAVGYWTLDEVAWLADALDGCFVIEPVTVGPGPDYSAIEAARRALAGARAAGAGLLLVWG